MTRGHLKKKVFVTPEKPGDAKETCWVEDAENKPRKPRSKAERRGGGEEKS